MPAHASAREVVRVRSPGGEPFCQGGRVGQQSAVVTNEQVDRRLLGRAVHTGPSGAAPVKHREQSVGQEPVLWVVVGDIQSGESEPPADVFVGIAARDAEERPEGAGAAIAQLAVEPM
jgi:hypothetical protein